MSPATQIGEHCLRSKMRASAQVIALVFVASGCAGRMAGHFDPPPLDSLALIHPNPKTGLVGPPERIDVSTGLRPEEAGWLALAASPSLQAIRGERNIAGAQVIAAGLLANPLLSTSFDQPVGGATQGSVPAFSAGVSWAISSLVGRSARVESAREAAQQVSLDVAWQEWHAFFTAQQLAWQLAAQARVVEVEEANGLDLSKQYEQTAAAAQKGLAPEVNALSARTALQSAKVRIIDARQALRTLQISLAESFGHPELSNVTIRASLEPPPWIEQLHVKPLLARLEERLDIRALDAALRGYSAAERAAALRAFPPIELGANIARDTGDLVTAGLSVTIGMPVFDHGQAEGATARTTREKVAWARSARLTSARAAVRTLLSVLETSKERIDALDTAVAKQGRLVEIHQAALDRGLVDAASYYLVRNQLLNLKIEAVRARLGLRIRLLELAMQSGRYPLIEGKRP